MIKSDMAGIHEVQALLNTNIATHDLVKILELIYIKRAYRAEKYNKPIIVASEMNNFRQSIVHIIQINAIMLAFTRVHPHNCVNLNSTARKHTVPAYYNSHWYQ
jgi:hypothetical protein